MVKRNIKNDKKKTNGWQSTSQKYYYNALLIIKNIDDIVTHENV
jgi:hypothetical protein